VSSATVTAGRTASARVARHRGVRPPRVVLAHVPDLTAALWIAPVAWAVYTSLRPYADTNRCGYVSLCGTYNFHNYTTSGRRRGCRTSSSTR